MYVLFYTTPQNGDEKKIASVQCYAKQIVMTLNDNGHSRDYLKLIGKVLEIIHIMSAEYHQAQLQALV